MNEEIFEMINYNGRNLSEFEMLRNNIFLRAGAYREKLYHKYWTAFEDTFWTTRILDQFLRDFLTAKIGIDIKTDDLFDLYEREYRSTLKADQGIEHELAELKQHAEVYQKVYVDISKKIARLTGLEFNERVLIRYDSATLKRESVQILFNAGLCTDSDAEQWDLRRDESETNFPIEYSIIDILGEYYPYKIESLHSSAKKEIVIYEKMCQLAAAALHVDIEILKEVVIAHEIAHAVTHLGKDGDGEIWEHFSYAETENKELFAQIYPLLYFKNITNSEALKVFSKLADHQQARYNSWRSYEVKPLSEINEALYQARSKQPFAGMEQKNILLNELFSPSMQYVIPSYQRSYAWSEENWIILWNDIKRISDLRIAGKSGNHFIGIVIVKPLPKTQSTDFHQYEIVDGHQRIATFQIIFAVIRDMCHSKDYQDIAEVANHRLLNSFSVVGQEKDPNVKYKLHPHSTDSDAFHTIVESRHTRGKHHTILQAYHYFKTQIAAYTNENINKIGNLLACLLYDFTVLKRSLSVLENPEEYLDFSTMHN